MNRGNHTPGSADRRHEFRERRVTRPGDAVHHAPWQEHCQDFGAAPTVLLYCWTGAVEPDAVLVG